MTALLLVLCLLLTACGQQGTTWQEQYDLGMRYLSEGNYEEAIIAFTAAIGIDPKRPEGFVGRGDAYALSGDTEDNLSASLADYEAALELDETLADAWLGLADVYIRRGDYDRAMEILREALENTGGDQSIADKIAEMESGNFTDSAGNVRRTSGYDESGALEWYWDHTYDAQGREATVAAYNADGSRMGFVELTYDGQGHQLRSYIYSPDSGKIYAVEYTYDAAGNRTSQIHYDMDGTVTSRSLFLYKNGLMVREDCYAEGGGLIFYWLYEYDGQRNRTKRSNYSADGALSYYQTWEYNEDGKVSVYTNYESDGTRSWYHVNLYDEEGNYLGYEDYSGDGMLTGTILAE